jgi:poly-gamma-glutamate synthesis protein (capsule biosynthesis protein)
VYSHWGDEYVTANAMQKSLARRFIDAGAEIVIGAHPHVVQEHELYAGKHIYYSLGNFIFDQYFNEQVRRGLMLELALDASGIADIREIPTYLERDRRTCPVG